MREEFIIDLRGKKYPVYGGILDEAHEKGLTKVLTELVQIPTKENEYNAIVKAYVHFGDKIFEAYGDASPKNVNSQIATALLRMAETRAKGRALRDGINCGSTMLEELPEIEETKVQTKIKQTEYHDPFEDGKSESTNEADDKKQMICSMCGKLMKERTGQYGDFWGCSDYPRCKNKIKK